MKLAEIPGLILFLAVAVIFGCLGFQQLETVQKQLKAESFPKTEGTILSGTVKSFLTRRYTEYYPHLTYRYEVHGATYTTDRISYREATSYNGLSANNILKAHPVGSKIDVFYNPNDPADALRYPGVRNHDIASAMLVFSLFGIAASVNFLMLVKLYLQLRPAGVAAGLKIITNGLETRVRMPYIAADGLSWAGFAFFVVAIAASSWLEWTSIEPIFAGIIALAMTFLLPLLIFIWRQKKSGFRSPYLVINHASKTLEIPATFGRGTSLVISFPEIFCITVEKVAHQGRNRVIYTFDSTLVLRHGANQRLTDMNRKRANAFSAWLAEKIGVNYDGALDAKHLEE